MGDFKNPIRKGFLDGKRDDDAFHLFFRKPAAADDDKKSCKGTNKQRNGHPPIQKGKKTGCNQN